MILVTTADFITLTVNVELGFLQIIQSFFEPEEFNEWEGFVNK